MTTLPFRAIALFAVSMTAFACASPPTRPAAATPDAASGSKGATGPSRSASRDTHVYRFDFVLASNDAGSAPSSTAFTLNLEENRPGELHIGKNVALGAVQGSSTPSRQDVGMKIKAKFNTEGEDILIDVSSELSALEGTSSIRKVVANSNAVARAGKSVLVSTLETDSKRYQLTVTPTKLR